MSALDDILAREHFEDNNVIERCVARSCVVDNDDAELAAEQLADLRKWVDEKDVYIDALRADNARLQKAVEEAKILLSDVDNFGGDDYNLRQNISKWLKEYKGARNDY